MNGTRHIALALAFLGFWSTAPLRAQGIEEGFYQQAVDYRNGEISMAFDQTPVVVALNVIEAHTGFQIVVPAAAENKLLNLRLNKLALEPAVRSLISTIGFNNFALMYDANGHLSRAVVLGAGSAELVAEAKPDGAAKAADAGVQALNAGERETLERDLERWSELNQEERGRIEDRLKALPPSEEREQLLKEYGRQLLVTKK